MKQLLFLEPLPGGARWTAAFGSLLLFVFLLQVVTGILLSMSYAPSVDSAWPSVQFIQEEVPLGAFIRAVHHWGSSAMVISCCSISCRCSSGGPTRSRAS